VGSLKLRMRALSILWATDNGFDIHYQTEYWSYLGPAGGAASVAAGGESAGGRIFTPSIAIPLKQLTAISCVPTLQSARRNPACEAHS